VSPQFEHDSMAHVTATALGFAACLLSCFCTEFRHNECVRDMSSENTQHASMKIRISCLQHINLNYTPWPESENELYRPSDRSLSAKLMPTLADRGFKVISATGPSDRILRFIDRV
jgi:hypothetical protein